ncbi:MAG: glutathione S-transferase N-terminal domain-containing protein [Hyphomicrobium aestuarii]|nr:glutathione S-transferase N-terminal domain-containing protein [Hyphomicrobium aestuarii]
MSRIVCSAKALSFAEFAVGIRAFNRSNSVPAMGIAILVDLIHRLLASTSAHFARSNQKEPEMLELYAFSTPNSIKPIIALEELGLDYALHSVNIRQGAQKTDEFVALNPNTKVPVLVDHDAAGGPLVLSESAAILIYLAEKTGKLLPAKGAPRARVFEQLFFHASGLGPAFGNVGFFRKFAPEPNPLAINRFGNEALRVLTVMDDILARNRFIAGDELTIADIAHFGWLWRRGFAEVTTSHAPNVERYIANLETRPAFQRAITKAEALAAA